MLFSMRTRIDYLADKYCFTVSASDIRRSNIVALTLQNGTNRPVFASSGRMFWRSAGRQRPGQKNTCVLHC